MEVSIDLYDRGCSVVSLKPFFPLLLLMQRLFLRGLQVRRY